jgi:hypothetical protein
MAKTRWMLATVLSTSPAPHPPLHYAQQQEEWQRREERRGESDHLV